MGINRDKLDLLKQNCKQIQRLKLNINLDDAMQTLIEIGLSFTDNFVIDKNNRFIFENLVKWVNGDTTMQALNPNDKSLKSGNLKAGLYIGGPIGTGKTMCLNIIKAYAEVVGSRILIGCDNYARRLSWNNTFAHDIVRMYQQKGNISEIEQRRILCIQNLGEEQDKTTYMGNSSYVIREMIERRGEDYDKLLLVTSNLPMNTLLVEKYGDRVFSRLQQMCNYFELKGKDRRIV